MHDPMTVAFCIPNPFRRRYSWGKRWINRPRLITIWHVDPECDGTDDSCGWFSPKLTKEQVSALSHAAWCEGRSPFYLRLNNETNNYATDALHLMECAFGYVGDLIRVRVAPDEARRWSLQAIRSDGDNLRHLLCFKAGWHSNSDSDRLSDREECALGLFRSVARWILRERRPWWKHPRWHLRHWKIQIHWQRKTIQSECSATK